MARLKWEVQSERKKVVRATAECPLGGFKYEPRGVLAGLWFFSTGEEQRLKRIASQARTLEEAQEAAEEFLADFDREWQAFYHGEGEAVDESNHHR